MPFLDSRNASEAPLKISSSAEGGDVVERLKL